MKAIMVENLSKIYSVATAQSEGMSFREMLVQQAQSFFKKGQKQEPFYALKNVSFEVRQGEVLGIIGKNGSGKSTLLKILSKITAPTSGRAIVHGRVASLLEVGTGFHAELTGRENIFMSGIILGMKRWEINKYFDEIVAFAGVEQFLDVPVKKYSSGMRLRLAFSVAAHLQPEILLVDEVLAVGDYEFEKRCLKTVENISNSGRTVIFVSHNMDTLRRLTKRAILLEKGAICADGITSGVIIEYLGYHTNNKGSIVWIEGYRDELSFVTLYSVKTLKNSIPCDIFKKSDSIAVEISYKVHVNNIKLAVGLLFYNEKGELLFTSFDQAKKNDFCLTSPGKYQAISTIPGNILNQGKIGVSIIFLNLGRENLFSENNTILHVEQPIAFTIAQSEDQKNLWDFYQGQFDPYVTWQLLEISQ